ncbi:hypothetical protein OG785_32230 [Streptomyces sp. NBC_00006]|uniref:hypothetical protein n=1 Tax=Streptomyces sp. NBC_00006 TaxID=2975619 RepID=UPI00224FE8B5|nr:hypothetical protein [Streptomyces sp. NBC_00006]MCX5535207.1 hypothetical protein [Streptomyces sp. NBC_00006]
MADTHPHITIGHHSRYGVVAATSHGNRVAEHMLGRVDFQRLPGSSMYALADPHRDPVRRGSQAVQSLRAAQYSVTSDAAYDLQPVSRPSSASKVPFDVFSHIADHGRLHPNSVTYQRRAHAAMVVSPARSSVTSHQLSLTAEHCPTPAPAQRVPARRPPDYAEESPIMNPHHEPDVAFGLIPKLGVAAAVSDDRPLLDEVLREHRFLYSPVHDVYLSPSDFPHTTLVHTVASAAREFQDNGLSVAADPKILLSPSPPVTEALLARASEPSVYALASELHDARQAVDVAHVLDAVLDDRPNGLPEGVASSPSARAQAATELSPHPPKDAPDTGPSVNPSAAHRATPSRTR